MSRQDEVDIVLAAVRAHTRVLKLPTVGRECEELARQWLELAERVEKQCR